MNRSKAEDYIKQIEYCSEKKSFWTAEEGILMKEYSKEKVSTGFNKIKWLKRPENTIKVGLVRYDGGPANPILDLHSLEHREL